jgi:hypothetical protein
MALIRQSAKDLESLVSDFRQIAENLQNCRNDMISESLDYVDIDVRTAITHIAWLKRWALKALTAPARGKIAILARQKRKSIENIRDRNGDNS